MILEDSRLRAVICPQTGALAELSDVVSGWRPQARRELGRSFRLHVPLADRRGNYVDGLEQQAPEIERSSDSVTLTWPSVHSRHGGRHPIAIRQRYELREGFLLLRTHLDNRSEHVVESVWAPWLGDVQAPGQEPLHAISYHYGAANVRSLWPAFENTAGYWGVDVPTQLPPTPGPPAAPFLLVQAARQGVYLGVAEASFAPVAWYAELIPGYGDTVTQTAPPGPDLDGNPVAVRLAAVHLPFLPPGQSVQLTPVALTVYQGDWQAGADVYRSWGRTWLTPSTPPTWASQPHSWQMIHLNSPEDELRVTFADLVGFARECAANGVTALQVVGWNAGGQDGNNPSHLPDPRLGGAAALRDAIAEIRRLGVRVVLFVKYTWADQSTARFRDKLVADAAKDPYGDPYQHGGYRYQTPTQLLDINTRRLVPMCFLSEDYLRLCEAEFQHALDAGADGILFDEACTHGTAMLCFDEAHGHRRGAPVSAGDLELIRRLRRRAGDREFLFAGEACYDWMSGDYHLSYHRSNSRDHVPLMRYLQPWMPIMTAATGFDDRNVISQALLYRYVISYEPYNFKGRLSDFPRTVAYGQAMNDLRTSLREWFWDGEFTGTAGATVTNAVTGAPHSPFAVYRHVDTRGAAVALANYANEPLPVRVRLHGHNGRVRYRHVDRHDWHVAGGELTLPPRSATVVLPASGGELDPAGRGDRS